VVNLPISDTLPTANYNISNRSILVTRAKVPTCSTGHLATSIWATIIHRYTLIRIPGYSR